MIVDPSTIQRAFEQHRLHYAKRERAWDVSYHIKMWRRARLAFGGGSYSDFEYVHEELRRVWQAFRGGTSKWEQQRIFDKLRSLEPALSRLQLRDLNDSRTDDLWRVLQEVQGLKMNTNGPSIVALSKFMHFWNPRLFVIVDQGVIWNWVLAHKWMWNEIVSVRMKLDLRLFGEPRKRADAVCDLASYLAILLWSGQLLRDNPAISDGCFRQYIESYGVEWSEVSEFDAAAAEWFILGLVEIPPVGVTPAQRSTERSGSESVVGSLI